MPAANRPRARTSAAVPRPAPPPPTIAVRCAHTHMVDLASLLLNPRNPNKHPEPQIALLVKIIQVQGWRAPIVVSNRSGYVVKGHGRVAAATRLACAQVPVDFQDYASDEEEMADLLADNRIAELAENDTEMLAGILHDLQGSDIDLDLTGFDQAALADLLGSEVPMGVPHARGPQQFSPPDNHTPPPTLERCPHCGKYQRAPADPAKAVASSDEPGQAGEV